MPCSFHLAAPSDWVCLLVCVRCNPGSLGLPASGSLSPLWRGWNRAEVSVPLTSNCRRVWLFLLDFWVHPPPPPQLASSLPAFSPGILSSAVGGAAFEGQRGR